MSPPTAPALPPPDAVLPTDIAIGLAGAEVASVTVQAGVVCIRLAVAQAWRSLADGGTEEGYLPAVEGLLTGAVLAGDVADAVGVLRDGSLAVDGQALARWRLPLAVQGDVRLALRFGNRTELSVVARGMHWRQSREAAFLPSLAC